MSEDEKKPEGAPPAILPAGDAERAKRPRSEKPKDVEELVGLLPRDSDGARYSGPYCRASLEDAAAVGDSKHLRRLGVEGIKILGLHKARPSLNPEQARAGLRVRKEGFALLACEKADVAKKLDEIKKAEAAARAKEARS